MGRMLYVPSEIVKDVARIKEARRKGLCYDIICYDSKEDNEKEEETFPHTPSREEEKEKEERTTTATTTKKSKKGSFFPPFPPSQKDIRQYHQEQGFTTFEADYFFNYYNVYGWKSKGGGAVIDWMSKMKSWEAYNLQKKQNNGTQSKKPGVDTKAGDGEEADWRALGEWLDAHYPVSVETVAAADEAIKKPEVTLKWWGYRIGTTATIRIVIKKLYRLGEALNTSRKGLKAEKLERIAREILWQAPEHTMQDLDQFFTRCKHGHYGNFPKGLLMTDLMRAWRKEEEII